MFLRKFNTLLVTGTTSIRIPIIKRAVVDFAVGADWTPTAGDVKVFVDAAAVANITNLPTAIASGNGAFWEFILTAAELSCKQLLVVVSDAATKAVEDQSFIVETYGNASAMYVTDFSAQLATPTNITAATGVVLSGVIHTGAVIPTVSVLTGHTAQTGDNFARLGAPAGASVSADIATRATPAQVNTEVVDALATDTYAEPGQGAPAATTTLAAKINYIYKFLRNKITTTSTQISIYDDAGTTVDHKSTHSDDATTYTRGEFGTGP